MMPATQAAIGGADGIAGCGRVGQAALLGETPVRSLEIELDVTVDDVTKVAVGGTVFFD